MPKAVKKELARATAKGFRLATHLSHKAEHPVHLIYFALVALHSSYQLAAWICLAVGCFCLIPIRDEAPAEAKEEEKA